MSRRHRAPRPGEDVQALLARSQWRRLAVENREMDPGGRNNPLSQQVMVARGRHSLELEILDIAGHAIGSIESTAYSGPFRQREGRFAVRDADGAAIVIGREVVLGLLERAKQGIYAWSYDITQPGGWTLALRKTGPWRDAKISISDGSQIIGALRPARISSRFGGGVKIRGLSIEDSSGQEVARVVVEQKIVRDHVDLIIDLAAGISDRLRRVALAALRIADSRLISDPGGG